MPTNQMTEADSTGNATDHEASKSPDVTAFKSTLEKYRHTDENRTQEVVPRTNRELRSRKRTPVQREDHEDAASPQPAKRQKKKSSTYAPPSTYAHLQPLPDVLAPNLICVFVGTNPGIRTATAGHAYAHPSNLFWKLLHSSGCTDTRLRPEQDRALPRSYGMGNTNIVSRPSRDAGELSKSEMSAGTPALEAKVARYRPEAVCIVGKGIWEAVWAWRHGRGMRKDEFEYGWQAAGEKMGRVEGGWDGAWVFVASSTSGLSAGLKMAEKEAIWAPFGEWVRRRRKEREEGKGEEEGEAERD